MRVMLTGVMIMSLALGGIGIALHLKDRERIISLEEKINTLDASYKLYRLDMRTDACISAINKLAKEQKMDLGFWVPTPAKIGGQE